MIKEAYCSYEIAKLLKEKGFAEPLVNYYYTTKGERVSYLMPEEQYLCPTHQMACAWLREIYGIDIIIEITNPSVKNRKYYCMIWDGNNNSYILDLFNSYEDAVEAALKYALENLIE